MSQTIKTINAIVEEQVNRFKKKSEKSRLTEEEVNVLKSLTEICLRASEFERKAPKKRTHASGARMTNDDLMKYASDE